jgi:hypothetical protein
MSEKLDPPNLEALLARIMENKKEKETPAQAQSQAPERTIEVDKILLRDAAGKYRGKISANADGSASLLLSDHEGKAWAWLGVNQAGEAFLELKDHHGEISYKVPAAPSSPQPAAAITSRPQVSAASPLDSQGAPPAAAQAGTAKQTPPSRPQDVSPPAPEFPEWKSGGRLDSTVLDRLQKLERKHRRRWFFRAPLVGLLLLVLAIQVASLSRPPAPPGPLEVQSLTVRGPNGALRAWLGEKDGRFSLDLRDQQGKLRAAIGVGAEGSPALSLFDEGNAVRAELALGPNGDAKFALLDNRGMPGKTEQNSPNDTSNQESPSPAPVSGDDASTISPPASQPDTLGPPPDTPAITLYVGSKTSNKYHLPTCKFAKTIRPDRLIQFKSVAEAQERQYIPCPVCKPPPLSP